MSELIIPSFFGMTDLKNTITIKSMAINTNIFPKLDNIHSISSVKETPFLKYNESDKKTNIVNVICDKNELPTPMIR